MEEIYTEEVEVNFDKNVMGSFGDFKTNTSHELNYIMATIDVSKISDLKTASSILNFQETKFEELVQRDIDYERVEDEIVEDYLEKGNSKFIFFPPLLVSPMITDKNGKIIDSFDTVDPVTTKKELTITYDNNIRIKFPRYKKPPKGYPYHMKNEKNKDIAFHNYATKFEYNSENVDLVVIDGQHRLVALKTLLNRSPEVLENIKIPICIFFAPEAFSKGEVSLTKSMRQLFVVINSTAKQVSGHFITLLSDDSLSSFVIREFADSLKSENKLHLLEWNERKEKRASQLNKVYSITTVKIIDDAIKDYILKTSLTSRVLNLSEIREDLYKQNNCELDLVDFDNDNFIITEKLKEQINKYLINNLKSLFLKPKPYSFKLKQLEKAFNDLDKKIKLQKKGSKSFKDNVLNEYREFQARFDASSVNDMQDEFLDHFQEETKYSFYYKNVFQQGYIKAWIDLFDLFDLLSKDRKNQFDITKFTEAFIDSIEDICFDEGKEIFSSAKEYTQNVLFKNTNIKVSKSSKEHISNLIKSIFLNKKSLKKFSTQIELSNELLFEYAKESAKAYFTEYTRANTSEIRKNWRTMFDSEDKLYLKLDDLTKNIDLDDNQDLFNKEIDLYTLNNTKKSKIIFSNILDINHEDISL